MSNSLVEYLSALEARDAREQAHAEYINAYTKLADRTVQSRQSIAAPHEPVAPSPTPSVKSRRPATPKGQGPPPSQDPSPGGIIQMREQLAASHKTRAELEAKLSALTVSVSTFQSTDADQKRRIAFLEKKVEILERKVRDLGDEHKGKRKLVEDVQDEMVMMQLELNMAKKDKEKLNKENAELTRRWVEKMEQEAQAMNAQNDRSMSGDRRRQ